MLTIFAFLLLCISCGYAQNTVMPSGRPITYRIGVGFAGEYASIDVDVKNKPDVLFPEDGDFSTNVHHSCRKFQISPSIELGTFLHDTYYLGFSLSKSYTNARSSMKVPMTNNYNFEHTFNFQNYVNAFFKVGYKPTSNIMFFGLFGPSFANWSHKTKVFYYNKAYSVDSTADLKNFESHIKTTGLGLGAGVEYRVSKNAIVSFQYGMHLHRTKTINYDYTYDQLIIEDDGFPNYAERNGGVQKKVRLSHSSIGLKFSYFFSF